MADNRSRILAIAELLYNETDEGHGLTREEIEKRITDQGYSIERKTFYKDRDALNEYGFEILEEKKSNTCYYYHVDKKMDTTELQLLVDAVQSSRFITEKKANELIRKIEGLTSTSQAKLLQGQVHVTNRIKTDNESIFYVVNSIQRAITTNRKITFQYYKWNVNKKKEPIHDGKIYEVSPWALSWDDKNYYLVCYYSEDEPTRHFRVDKMMNVKILEEKRDGADFYKKFDMAIYSRLTFGMFNGEEKTVRLLCDNDMADAIIDRFGRDLIFAPVDDKMFRVNVKAHISPVFLTWLMNFSGKIRIEGPADVQEEYRKLAQAALDSLK